MTVDFASTVSSDNYPMLAKFATPLKSAERDIVGRDVEIDQMLATMYRPELCNILLLADAGTGKTALVQGTMLKDVDRLYLEVNLSRMIADNADEMPMRIKDMFSEAERYAREQTHELVLFMDEFHQIVQLSAAAVEALKPVLADSGTRQLRIIAATTFEEFHRHIASNLPLVERFERFNVAEPDRKTTIQILRGMAQRYGVDAQFVDDHMFDQIYEYTNRYVPQSSQPRKSIKILDAMVGQYRYYGRAMDKTMLADVLMRSVGVNVAFRADATSIKKALDKRVFAQDAATSIVSRRLQICVADLQDKSRPMASFLFAGSTGVGKACRDDTPVMVLSPSGEVCWKSHGDLAVGDRVFTRRGTLTTIIGVFRQPEQDIYRVTFADGRSLDVAGSHLWPVFTAKDRANVNAGKRSATSWRVMSTTDLLDQGVARHYDGSDRRHAKFFVPTGQGVDLPEADLPLDPYALGALIANGCLTDSQLILSSSDPETVEQVRLALGSPMARQNSSGQNYSWTFRLPDDQHVGSLRTFQTAVVLDGLGLAGVKSASRRIPEQYLLASRDQRWALVQGLFDCDGTISNDDRFRVTYSTFSEGLASDVRMLLLSLGVTATVSRYERFRTDPDGSEPRRLVEYVVRVKTGHDEKTRFFRLPRKADLAQRAATETMDRSRVKKFDMTAITSIEKVGYEACSCIYVGDDEHLYQAGEFVVTHNTEMTKQLSELLFGDAQRSFIRFDMTEYVSDDSQREFQHELAQQVWDHPYSVILLDEIEKASKSVTRTLMQVLDDGRLTDENGRQVQFINTYIVMTTNAGKDVFANIGRYESSDTGDGSKMAEYEKMIRDTIIHGNEGKFPAELLGRIDVLVPFQPLNDATKRKIVTRKLSALKKEVRVKHDVILTFDERVVDYLIGDKADSETDAGGAREAIRYLTNDVTSEVAAFVNDPANANVHTAGVFVEGELVSENQYSRVSNAKIVVREVVA